MIQLDAIRHAIEHTRKECVAIYELCQLARCPERAQQFVLDGTPVHAVQRALAKEQQLTTEPELPAVTGFDRDYITRELAKSRAKTA